MNIAKGIRKTIFWGHLVLGLVAGLVIAIMSFTGLALTFEKELLEWSERHATHVTPPSADAEPLALESLLARIAEERPDFVPESVTIPKDRGQAYTFNAHWSLGPLYADPFSGELRSTQAEEMQHFLWEMEEWHRWLAFKDGSESAGRIITGVANLAFVALCLSGLYLWWPRRWRWSNLRPILWFRRARGKARDYNWHLVLGLWSLPVLVVLTVTAVPISFRWGHELPFQLFGEEPPQARGFGMMSVPPAKVSDPPVGTAPAPYARALSSVTAAFPEWESLYFELPPATAPDTEDAETPPLTIGVVTPDPMPSRGYIPTEVDPFTGELLQSTHFDSRSPGLKTRVWMRFLHTGEAFGMPSKIIAFLATAASLVLVYTGFALSWRRFFRRPKS